MEKLLPVGEPITFVPESYIQPVEVQPGKTEYPVCKDIPIIDFLDNDRAKLVDQIMRAGQDIGIIFLINHGVPEELIYDMLNVAREFHELPNEDKADMYSWDKARLCRYYTSLDYPNEKAHFWRNILVHHKCNPEAENTGLFPEKPANLREIAGTYSVELRKVMIKVMDMICEGLGIDAEHYCDKLTTTQKLAMNYYPPCPDPSVVLGLPPHDDTNPLTVLVQQSEYSGYQIFKNGQWMIADPPPNSMIVNFGFTLEMISNGKIKGDWHRVVLHDKLTRVTVASSIHPGPEYKVEPSKELTGESNPAMYKDCLYQDLHGDRTKIHINECYAKLTTNKSEL